MFSRFVYTGDDTPSPQVGSPKVDSDGNDSPNHPSDTIVEEDKEGVQEGEGGETKGGEEGKEEKEEDPSTRSEGVVHFVLTDLTNLESRLSEPVVIRNVPW